MSCSLQLSDGDIQSYHDRYTPRMNEMIAFNMVSVIGSYMSIIFSLLTLYQSASCCFLLPQLKVTLAPCIEGLILLDRLCYLKEQVKKTIVRADNIVVVQFTHSCIFTPYLSMLRW